MSGWKTYLAAFLGILVVGAHGTGFIDDATARILEDFLGFVGLAAIRKAIPPAQPPEPKS